MRNVFVVAAAVLAASLIACGTTEEGSWFEGDFAQAQAEAQQRDTLIMIDFYTDWCGWCRRLDAETLSDSAVRRELGYLVAMRLNAEREGDELARHFGVTSFPTLVFVDAAGNEIDRILGFLPPEQFLDHVQRVRAGDTLAACLLRLKEDPSDRDALEKAIPVLLERSDPEGALDRLEAFHEAVGTDGSDLTSAVLMFRTKAELVERTYQRVARRYRMGWEADADFGSLRASPTLESIHRAELAELSEDEIGNRLREALYQDAAAVLRDLPQEGLGREELFASADFAFRTGHCKIAGELYRRWYDNARSAVTPDVLNTTAWRLYLCGAELELALEMAQQAYEANDDADTADTLGRVLYVNGRIEEAIIIQQRAADEAEGDLAEVFAAVVSQMREGVELGDAPPFESFPGPVNG